MLNPLTPSIKLVPLITTIMQNIVKKILNKLFNNNWSIKEKPIDIIFNCIKITKKIVKNVSTKNFNLALIIIFRSDKVPKIK